MNLRETIESKLKKDEFIFDEDAMELFEVRELMEKGKHPVCSKCGARLRCALTPEAAKESGNPPGVSCPTNLSHCEIVVNFARKR